MSSEMADIARTSEREEQIRQRAYRLWEEAGQPEGAAQDHWDRAAQDLDREDAEKTGSMLESEKPPTHRT